MAFQTIDGSSTNIFGPNGKPSGQDLGGRPSGQGAGGFGGVPQNPLSTGAGYASGINTGNPFNTRATGVPNLPLSRPTPSDRGDFRIAGIVTETKNSSFRAGQYNEWLNQYTSIVSREQGIFSEGFEVSPNAKDYDNSQSLFPADDGMMVPGVVFTAMEGGGPNQLQPREGPHVQSLAGLSCDPCKDPPGNRDYTCLDPRCAQRGPEGNYLPAAPSIRCDTITGCGFYGDAEQGMKRPVFTGTYTTYDQFGGATDVTGYFIIKTNPTVDWPPIPGNQRAVNMNRCVNHYIPSLARERPVKCCNTEAEGILAKKIGRICTWKWAVSFVGTDFTGISNRSNCETDKPLRDPSRWAYEGNPCNTGTSVDPGSATSGNLYMCSCNTYAPCGGGCKAHVLKPIGAYIVEGSSGDPCECQYAYNRGAKFLAEWSGAAGLTGCGSDEGLNKVYPTVWTGCGAVDQINPCTLANAPTGHLPGYGNQSNKYAIASGTRPYWDDTTCGFMTPIVRVYVPNRFQTGCASTGTPPIVAPTFWCPSGEPTYVSDRYIFREVSHFACKEGEFQFGEDTEYCCCTGEATGTMCDRVYETGAAYALGEYVHFDGSGTESLFEYPPCGASGMFRGGITGYKRTRWEDRNWKINKIRWSGARGTESENGISGFDCGYVYDLYHTTCADESGSCSNGVYLGAREDSLSRTGLMSCVSGTTGVGVFCTGVYESGGLYGFGDYVCWNGESTNGQSTPGPLSGRYSCNSGYGNQSGGCNSWVILRWSPPDLPIDIDVVGWFSGNRTGLTSGACDWLYAIQCYGTGGPDPLLDLPSLDGPIYTGIAQNSLWTGCCR